MNKLIGFLAILFLVNACDDGDVAIQDIKFEDVAGAGCGQIVYKLKGNEALILKITQIDSAFKNDQTKLNEPRIYAIDASNQVIYRAYNGVVSSDNICSTPPATKPDNTEEWTATGGTIEITTTINKTTDPITNASTIVGYNHFVQFKNITFRKPNGDQFYDVYNFGTYKTTITPINLTFSNTVTLCTAGTNNIITNRRGTVALLSYDNNPNNLNASIGVKNAVISATNKLFYRTFSALNINNYLCVSAFGLGSNLEKEWVATTGSVEITTTSNSTGFKHTINLKGVTLKNGNSDFYLGDNFNAGEYLN